MGWPQPGSKFWRWVQKAKKKAWQKWVFGSLAKNPAQSVWVSFPALALDSSFLLMNADWEAVKMAPVLGFQPPMRKIWICFWLLALAPVRPLHLQSEPLDASWLSHCLSVTLSSPWPSNEQKFNKFFKKAIFSLKSPKGGICICFVETACFSPTPKRWFVHILLMDYFKQGNEQRTSQAVASASAAAPAPGLSAWLLPLGEWSCQSWLVDIVC